MFNLFRTSLAQYRHEVELLESKVHRLKKEAEDIDKIVDMKITEKFRGSKIYDDIQRLVTREIRNQIKKSVTNQSEDINIVRIADEFMKEYTSGDYFLDDLVRRLNNKQLNYSSDSYSGRI